MTQRSVWLHQRTNYPAHVDQQIGSGDTTSQHTAPPIHQRMKAVNPEPHPNKPTIAKTRSHVTVTFPRASTPPERPFANVAHSLDVHPLPQNALEDPENHESFHKHRSQVDNFSISIMFPKSHQYNADNQSMNRHIANGAHSSKRQSAKLLWVRRHRRASNNCYQKEETIQQHSKSATTGTVTTNDG